MKRRILGIANEELVPAQERDGARVPGRRSIVTRPAGSRISSRAHDAAPAIEDGAAAPRAYPAEAILTAAQLATWLQISEAQVQRLNLPAVRTGKRRWRYIAGQVLDELKRRAE